MDIRDATKDDLEAIIDVRRRSFGPEAAAEPEAWSEVARQSIADRSLLVVTDRGSVVGAARIRHFTQWWSGSSLRLAGIGGVVIAPEARGKGAARALMTAVLDRCRELGFAMTALFPATTGPYHAVGYELAGRRRVVDIPAEALRRLPAPRIDVRRAVTGDEALVNRTLAAVYAQRRDDGPFEPDPEEWTRTLRDPDAFTYLADDGVVSYRFDRDRLRVDLLAASSRETLLGLWRLVGSGSSIVKTVRACVGPDDPVHWFAPGLVDVVKAEPFMLRVIDAAAAVAGRGFPAGLTVEVPLHLRDDELPGNAGDVTLMVSGGRGNLVPGVKSMPLELGPRGLAALFAGVPPSTLRNLELAAGGSRAGDAELSAAFAAKSFMVIYF